MSRREDLAQGLARVNARIEEATAAAGREPGSVQLVVVTKYFPASDVRLLADLGVTDVGENRHQEAEAKAAECADLGLRWHHIGGLQSNKASAVARYTSVVESVDRLKLVAPLGRGVPEGRTLEVLLQVSLEEAGAPGRSGADPADLSAMAAAVLDTPSLRLGGLMAVAPLGEDPDEAFARLARVRASFLTDHPGATTLSAGMSGDLEAAVRHGATHVRVGSAILGPRPVIQ